MRTNDTKRKCFGEVGIKVKEGHEQEDYVLVNILPKSMRKHQASLRMVGDTTELRETPEKSQNESKIKISI